jgi:hypothetical protein
LNARHTLLMLLAAAVTTLGSTSVKSNTVPGDVITGSVTAVNGRQSITIQGQTYQLKDGSPALAAAAHLNAGQSVTVQLNGPATSSSSQVINIVIRSGQ